VFRANRPAGPLDATTELDGAALEGLVAQHLHAWRSYSGGKHSMHYWQTRSRIEVDFVIYGESGLYAIEVKNSRRVDLSDLIALKHFAQDYPQSQRYLLYRGEDRIKRDGVLCMPCEEFLLAFRPDSFPD
jgi:predicted AAA+ superfamily ATPase